MTLNVEGKIPDIPSLQSLRLVSFNINGFKTLNHYHPWNDLNNLSDIFNYLKADIITFQELKLQKFDINKSIANINGYHSFISIPQTKRGYSGVAVFVKSKINNNNDHDNFIKVIKVEEGITGYLSVSSKDNLTYRKIWEKDGETSLAIGGYSDNIIDWKEGLKLDSDGRCILIELNNNIIIISVYCLANSMGTEDEEIKRCLFLSTLLKRVENLQKMGKHVIIMGDINVAPSLIDRDDSMNIGLKSNKLIMPTANDKSLWFEKINKNEVLNFRNETLSRQILNDYLYDFNDFDEEKNKQKILFDLGRLKNLNRLKMYTCWNTLKNNRPLNIGARIDLFLSTFEISKNVEYCDIWSFLYGSDHCPIFCDINISNFKTSDIKPNIKHFEAVNYYGLGTTKSIDTFFKFKSKPRNEPETKSETEITTTTEIKKTMLMSKTGIQLPTPKINKRSTTVPIYTSRKKQKGQSTLTALVSQMKEAKSESTFISSSLFVAESEDEDEAENGNGNENDDENINKDAQNRNTNTNKNNCTLPTESDSIKRTLTSSLFNDILNNASLSSAPQCDHREPCVLRTTKKGVNAGRKFWCCAKPSRNDTWTHHDSEHDNTKHRSIIDNNRDNNKNFSCSFFKWAQK
jgi:AP endonuclease-2